MNKVTLVVGDWSHDGHAQTENFTYEVNVTKDELYAAYVRGVKVCGVDWTQEVVAEYEDSAVPIDVVKKLLAHGIDIESWISDEDEDEDLTIEPYQFAEVWLMIARLGEHTLEWRVIVTNDRINIGGYGLFY